MHFADTFIQSNFINILSIAFPGTQTMTLASLAPCSTVGAKATVSVFMS